MGRSIRWAAALAALLAGAWLGCSDDGSGGGGAPPPSVNTPDSPIVNPVTNAFTESGENFLNPERGFYGIVDLTSGASYASIRTSGFTLAYAGVRLDAFRNAPLSASFLTSLSEGFARVRAAGIKVVLRFVYNAGFTSDAPKSIVLTHLNQLKPLLAANVDVIAVMQAGFIGAWGEWHASTNGLDNTTDRRDILFAILDALPGSRMVCIRTPHFKKEIFDGAGPILLTEAFNGSRRSRVGHHNDCFLSSGNDVGTYRDPIEEWKDYIAQDCRFTPMGGETCGYDASRARGPLAVAEMERLHVSYLNYYYSPDVIEQWRSQGYLEEIRRRMGYRLVLDEVSHSSAVPPGGVLEVEVKLRNVGFASLHNARPVYIVLENASTRLAGPAVDADPRRWEPGMTHTFQARLRLPESAASGMWRMYLWLPDDAAALRPRSEYSVRLANDGVWDAARGYNRVGDVSVDPSAGTVDLADGPFQPLQ